MLANLVTAAVLIAAGAAYPLLRNVARRTLSLTAASLAALPIALGVLLCLYVFGEDDYRDTGVSRWDAYRSPGGALGPMFILSVALLAACAALMLFSGQRGRAALLSGAALAGGITSLVLVTATIIGFTAN